MSLIQFIEERRSVTVECALEKTLLQASLAAGISHYHACGGLGRCSTCRVMVLDGIEAFGPRTKAEAELASARRWPEKVRLACQSRPTGPATVRRVVNDDIDADLATNESQKWPAAEEREIALLFCDIERFTTIVEHQLAYDIAHALNRFFKQIGDPILANGGVIDKYIGDAVFALFGIAGGSREENCRRAVRAGLRILAAAKNLNGYLQDHFGFSFEPRIGIHFGRVIVGQFGHPEKIEFTVIGDAVNTASRIEQANKDHGTRLLASEEVVECLLDSLEIGKVIEDSSLRGRTSRHRLYEVLGFRNTDPVFQVQSTYETIAPHADAFAKCFYARLFELDPEVEKLFAAADMANMRRMLMRMLGMTVRGLPEVLPQLRELGARHVGYGVKADYFPAAGEALVHALKTHLGSEFTPEVQHAWTDVFAVIQTEMLTGAGGADATISGESSS